MRTTWLATGLLLLASSGAAETYRCVDSAGRSRFTNDPVCANPEPVRSRRELVRPSPPEPAAVAPSPDDAANEVPNPEALFLPATAVAGAWEILREAPEAPDAALRGGGLRASSARHYTRARGPVTEVCSVEIWAFDHDAQARAVAHSLRRDDWKILQSKRVLILLHGVRLERGIGSRRGLVEGCAELGERTRAGIEEKEAARKPSAP